MKKKNIHMLHVFQNKWLRRITHVFWPFKIYNAEHHEQTVMLPISIVRGKKKKTIEVDWACQQNTAHVHLNMAWTRNFFLSILRAWAVFNCLILGFWVMG